MNQTLHVRVPEKLLARVCACAREVGIPRAEFIRSALAAACLEAERTAARRARLEAKGKAGG